MCSSQAFGSQSSPGGLPCAACCGFGCVYVDANGMAFFMMELVMMMALVVIVMVVNLAASRLVARVGQRPDPVILNIKIFNLGSKAKTQK